MSVAYAVGMCLPTEACRRVALRLLGSVDQDDAFERATEIWLRTEAAAAYDALKADPSRAIPVGDVLPRLTAKWATGS